MKDISKRIKELRLERNMTQDDLAERLHVTRQAVSSWETKKTRPDVEMLESIAQVFEIELTELLYGKKKEHRSDTTRFGGTTNPKMIKQAKIFGLIFIIGFLSRFLIVPVSGLISGLLGESGMEPRFLLTMFGVVVVNWSFACLGPFVLALISIKNDISIQSAIWRKRALRIGIALAVVSAASWPAWGLYAMLDLFELPNSVSMIFAMVALVVSQNRYILMAIASLIWLGKKEPAEVEPPAAADDCQIEIE